MCKQGEHSTSASRGQWMGGNVLKSFFSKASVTVFLNHIFFLFACLFRFLIESGNKSLGDFLINKVVCKHAN